MKKSWLWGEPKKLIIAVALLFVWQALLPFVSFDLPFWTAALFPNSVAFWLVFYCPARPVLNAVLFALAFLVFGAIAVGVERILFSGVEPSKYTTAVQMYWALGLFAVVPGLIAGLVLRWLPTGTDSGP